MPKSRYCFVKDDDGHDYCIPVDGRKDFNELLADEDHNELERRFGKFRLGSDISFYSFTNVREER